jgi:hypothetical protein
MTCCRVSGPADATTRARSTALAEAAEEFHIARDADRAAVLVAYTLLGAAINGFVPV